VGPTAGVDDMEKRILGLELQPIAGRYPDSRWMLRYSRHDRFEYHTEFEVEYQARRSCTITWRVPHCMTCSTLHVNLPFLWFS
jgi:hypothetical protein